MDDLDLIRGFASDEAEPDEGARERVGARLAWGIEARSAAAADGPAAPQDARPRAARARRDRPRRLRRLTIAAAAAALLIVAASLGIAQLLRPNPAEAAVQFSRDDGYIVAMVTDPFAAQAQLRAAFAAHGLDIDLKLLPASPSVVGTVIFLEGNGIETLQDIKYDGPKGEQPVGLRIPVDFKGHAAIALARPAKPGEKYESAGDAFAPGEELHGVRLVGMTVADAAVLLGQKGLTVSWRVDVPADSPAAKAAEAAAAKAKPSQTPTPTTTTTATAVPTPTPTAAGATPVPAVESPGGALYSLVVEGDAIHKYDAYYVTGAVPMAAGSVVVFTAAKPPDRQQ